VRLDHVIYATADLDAAAARVEAELGLAVHAGGRHEGMGTHNRIVPLGGGYLELLAVADAEEAAGSALGAALLRRIGSVGEGLLGYAVAVDDVAAAAARLGVSITTITRSGFTGRLAGVAEALAEPCLPFFVHRARHVPDPGADGRAGGLAALEVSGDAARLSAWLDGAELPVRIQPGDPALRTVRIGAQRLIHADGAMRLG
jgi:catechol 2,3-dioxygenase-like lactoylglutathione lyase family enzyme